MSFNQETYYENISRQYEQLRKLMADCPDCEFCGKSILTDDQAGELCNKVGRWPDYCTGVQYMQENPFSAEIYNDHTLYMMCDGEAYEAGQDI